MGVARGELNHTSACWPLLYVGIRVTLYHANVSAIQTTESIAAAKSEKKAKRVAKRNKRLGITAPAAANGNGDKAAVAAQPVDSTSSASPSVDVSSKQGEEGGSTTGTDTGTAQRRIMHARVEEVGDDEE